MRNFQKLPVLTTTVLTTFMLCASAHAGEENLAAPDITPPTNDYKLQMKVCDEQSKFNIMDLAQTIPPEIPEPTRKQIISLFKSNAQTIMAVFSSAVFLVNDAMSQITINEAETAETNQSLKEDAELLATAHGIVLLVNKKIAEINNQNKGGIENILKNMPPDVHINGNPHIGQINIKQMKIEPHGCVNENLKTTQSAPSIQNS
jgi:hypothetical protein